ncbi:MAG: Na/Pi cotransporter family protein [Clostridia bacterium]|nr:Na/Pi cotransporter family protein [Clostridia bacterium]
MDIFDILSLVGGLALFLFGMQTMGNALEKKAGGKLKSVLSKMTSNPLSGFLLGLGVTAVIQSSSATTVMVVGFVNSGVMTLHQAISIIMGANIGTTVTAWILSLAGISSSNPFIQLFKPDSFVPVLALIGIVFLMFSKNNKKKDTATILLGFAVLMTGMSAMSDAVAGLKDVPEFTNILTFFTNPILGVLAGAVLTAIIQSSSASVGILQALSSTGAITFGAAIPIIMGQNIGTTVTAMISSLGANKNAKRTAFVHLYFNLIGTAVLLATFYGLDAVIGFAFTENTIDETGIAIVHTAFNLLCTIVWAPFTKVLEKLAVITVKDTEEKEHYEILDERLFATPSVAVDRSRAVTEKMAEISVEAITKALSLLGEYKREYSEEIIKAEKKADKYEDKLGSYLVKVSSLELSDEDSVEATKLLHIISDFERISDHAVNVLTSAEEIEEKKLAFSEKAKTEMMTLVSAVEEITLLAYKSFKDNDLHAAIMVEPLEQVVDDLRDKIKSKHIKRLQEGRCTIELGFILGDLLTDLERVSDHCSNIAGLVLEMEHKGMDIHKYLRQMKKAPESDYNRLYDEYSEKYSIA